MKKGGYQILDFTGYNIQGGDHEPVIVAGFAPFDIIKSANGKMILVSGFNDGYHTFNDVIVDPIPTRMFDHDVYRIIAYGYTIDIYDTNGYQYDLTSAYSTATTTAAGTVKKAAKVNDAAGDTPTAAEFNALISALKSAGIMSY